MLLLDHVGAKTGTRRTTPLLYLPDGDDLVIVASKGGYPHHPSWYHNLRAHPEREDLVSKPATFAIRARDVGVEVSTKIFAGRSLRVTPTGLTAVTCQLCGPCVTGIGYCAFGTATDVPLVWPTCAPSSVTS